MKTARFSPLALLTVACLALAGCLVSPAGGPGTITVTNSNPTAIIAAANDIFPRYGYTMGTVSFPDSVSFDKPAGAFGKLLYGSYGTTTSVRATVVISPAGGNDYRLGAKVARVSDAGEAGFEDSTSMNLWSGEFKPLLRQVAAQASGAGGM